MNPARRTVTPTVDLDKTVAGIKRPRARVPDLNFEIKRGGYQQSCGFEQCDAHAPTLPVQGDIEGMEKRGRLVQRGEPDDGPPCNRDKDRLVIRLFQEARRRIGLLGKPGKRGPRDGFEQGRRFRQFLRPHAPDAEAGASHIWVARLSTANAAWRMASGNVGWA